MPVGEIQFWVSLSPAAADSASTPRRMRSELYSQGPAAYIPGTVVPNMDKFCAALDRDPEDLSWMFWTPWGRPDDGLPSGQSALWPDAWLRLCKNDYWLRGAQEWPQTLKTLARTYPRGWLYVGKPENSDTEIFPTETATLSIYQRLARSAELALGAGLGVAWDATGTNNTWYPDLRRFHTAAGIPLGTEPFVAPNTGWTADPTVTGFVLAATVRKIIAADFSPAWNADRNHLCKMAVLLESAGSTTQSEVANWRSRNWDVYVPMDASQATLEALNVYP